MHELHNGILKSHWTYFLKLQNQSFYPAILHGVETQELNNTQRISPQLINGGFFRVFFKPVPWTHKQLHVCKYNHGHFGPCDLATSISN